MKKSFVSFLLFMIFIIPFRLFSNVSDYVFSQSTGTFTSIHTSGTYIAAGCTSSVFGNLPIGFTFNYNGTDYTQFGLCCSGWISMGPAAPNTSIYPLSQGPTNNVIAPFAAQLSSTVAGDGIYYKTEGSAPNRVLVVEWWSYGFWFNGFDEICFQIRLYEASNEIRFVYTTNDEYSIRNIQVGLRGASNSDFINRQTTTNWSQTTAGTSNTAYCLFSPGITPPAGLTFIFTPNPVGIIKYNYEIPAEFKLYQNYPNPFNPVTNIKYQVMPNVKGQISKILLAVYDITGKEIIKLVNKQQSAGTYKVEWDASGYSSGIYFYAVTAASSDGKIQFKDVKKMVVLK